MTFDQLSNPPIFLNVLRTHDEFGARRYRREGAVMDLARRLTLADMRVYTWSDIMTNRSTFSEAVRLPEESRHFGVRDYGEHDDNL